MYKIFVLILLTLALCQSQLFADEFNKIPYVEYGSNDKIIIPSVKVTVNGAVQYFSVELKLTVDEDLNGMFAQITNLKQITTPDFPAIGIGAEYNIPTFDLKTNKIFIPKVEYLGQVWFDNIYLTLNHGFDKYKGWFQLQFIEDINAPLNGKWNYGYYIGSSLVGSGIIEFNNNQVVSRTYSLCSNQGNQLNLGGSNLTKQYDKLIGHSYANCLSNGTYIDYSFDIDIYNYNKNFDLNSYGKYLYGTVTGNYPEGKTTYNFLGMPLEY